jgi:hypothetical protein
VKRSQERILAHIVCLVGPDDPSGDPKHDIPMALDERLEPCQIAPARSLDERAIRIGLL